MRIRAPEPWRGPCIATIAMSRGVLIRLVPSFLTFVASAALTNVGCGGGQQSDMVGAPGVPTITVLVSKQASLGGRVLDGSGAPIAGAVVHIAETDAQVMTDASGVYQFNVAAESTLSLNASAPGKASTYRESIILAADAAINDFDIHLLTPDVIRALNGVSDASTPPTRGVVALRLHATDATCALAGARVVVSPPSAATVSYAGPASAGPLDTPDPAATNVQAGADISAWLLSAIPPGNMNLLRIDVQRDNCAIVSPSPSMGGATFPGYRQVVAGALTEADLFLQ